MGMESIAKLSFDQKLIVHIRASGFEIHGESWHMFNIVILPWSIETK